MFYRELVAERFYKADMGGVHSKVSFALRVVHYLVLESVGKMGYVSHVGTGRLYLSLTSIDYLIYIWE